MTEEIKQRKTKAALTTLLEAKLQILFLAISYSKLFLKPQIYISVLAVIFSI